MVGMVQESGVLLHLLHDKKVETGRKSSRGKTATYHLMMASRTQEGREKYET